VSVVKINAITVPRERFAEFEERFARRAGKAEDARGFERLEVGCVHVVRTTAP
jgi:heme-degrading monooxygenase HmoA